ncbi:cadherin domain protein, partial [Ancylostoma caninum]
LIDFTAFKGHFYNCTAYVWKGRVSTNIEIYVLPPNPRTSRTTRPAREQLEFWIRENAPYGSVVGRASSPNGDAPVTYSIIGNIGLSIDPQSGILKTETVFDHEAQQLHNFKLRSTYASGEFIDREAILLIDDENDNIPRFEHETYSVRVMEDIAIGEEILRLKWSDRDFNNAFHLSIVEGNQYGQFEVDHEGRITVSSPLDREQLSVHRLVVRLSDGIAPYPYHTTDCTVTVTLMDVNDNAPEFISHSEFQVEENSHRSRVVGRVIATDPDDGLNAQISYRILPETLPWAEFIIDAVHGDIMVNKPLDYEQRSNYTFTVVAMDYGIPQLLSEQRITVFLVDINDNVPVIRSRDEVVDVEETAPRGSQITSFEVLDDDTNDSSIFEIEEGYGIFDVSPLSGQLFLATPLDFETQTEYNVTVSARNIAGGAKNYASIIVRVTDANDETPRFVGGSPVQFFVHENLPGSGWRTEWARCLQHFQGKHQFIFNKFCHSLISHVSILLIHPFKIVVLDDNDNAPEFTQPYYIVHVRENSMIGEKILQVKATDRDEGLNGVISPPKSSITSIDIVVEDENDNKPIFDKVLYTANVLENSDPQQVLCVSASDRDLRENASITYSITSGNVMDAFSIDSATGCLRTVRGLDRESISDYRLVVQATDRGSPPQSAEAIVKVKVLDEDDNAPKFSHLFHAEVSEDLKVGSPILLISATDPDGYANHTFSIDNELDTPFSIDTHTGQINLREPLDREKNSSYRLRVRVSDGTWAVQTGAAIDILDINDNAPIFEENRYVFMVNRSQTNRSIGTIRAADADEGANGVVHYRFQQDIRYLSIDVISGDLRLLRVPDRAVVTVGAATVIAQDNGIQPMTSSALVTVVFTPERGDSCEMAVSEDATPGTILGKIDEYCDCPDDINVIRQFIANESYVKLDTEENFVVVRDLPRSDDVTTDLICELRNGSAVIHRLKLELIQDNEHAPQFREKIFHFTIAENITEGDLVGIVEATDSDVGPAGKLRYSIHATDDVSFRVLRNGTVVLAGILDYESQKRYVFNVTAIDGGQPSRNATAQVVVDLLDVDDSAPILEEPELVYAVTSTDDVICRAVFDSDTSNADLRFFTKSPNAIRTATHSCIKINNTVPPIIDWIVSDQNQSIIRKVKLLDMVPTVPVIWDENVTVSENAVDGTIVAAYENTIFANQKDQLSVDENEVKVTGGRGVHNEQLTIYAKSKFGRVVRSSTLTVTSSRVAPSPVFPRTSYSFNISALAPADTVVHDFHMTVPADCHLELVSGNDGKAFCLSKKGSLTVCGPLKKPSYRILAEVVCGNRTTSRSEIPVTVNPSTAEDVPLVGFVRENLPTAVIGQLPEDSARKFTYHIGEKRLRETFSISADGTLMTLKPLKRSVRSVYSIPIVAQPTTGRPSSKRFIVFVDEDAAGRTTVQQVNATALLTDTTAEFNLNGLALESPLKCQPINNDQYAVSSFLM